MGVVRAIACFGVALLSGCETSLLTDAGVMDGGVTRCTLSGDVTEDTVLGATFCTSYVVEVPVAVRQGATLSIASGTELRFERGAGLTVGEGSDGRLEILGVLGHEVVLTSLAPYDDPAGRWNGIVFRGSTLPGSVVRHALIENAGGSEGGCLTLENTAPNAVALEAIEISACATAGLWIDVPSFEITPPISIHSTEIGVSVAARNVGLLALPLGLVGVKSNEIRGGTVSQSASWIAQSVPWVIRGDIDVEGAQLPVLALEPGLHLMFDPSTWLAVGDGAPGALTVLGTAEAPVILEASSNAGFHGVVVGLQADLRTAIDHAVLRGGGRRGEDVRGCLTIRGSTAISISNTLFDSCEQAGIGAIDPQFRFAGLTDNAFVDSNAGLWLNARAVGTVLSRQSFDGVGYNVIEGDEIGRSAVWIGQQIPWVIRDSITVQGADDPILRLEAGVQLRFPPSSWLQIGSAESGGLVAIGEETKPVIFESTLPSPQPGSWRGIVFGNNARASSRLEHAVVRHAGQAELDAKGCVTIRGSAPRPISIVDNLFESCAQAAIAAVDGTFTFEALFENLIRNSEVGLHFSASAVGNLRSLQTYDNVRYNRITGDRVEYSADWIMQGVPWLVQGTIAVEGADAPVLTLEAGMQLRFDDGASMTVGAEALAGGLVIAGLPSEPVIFESAQDSPAPGDWPGILLGPSVSDGTRIDYLTLAHAGQPAPGFLGGITLLGTESRVRIAASTFVDNAQADLFVDCRSQPLLLGNLYSAAGVVFEAGCN